MNKAIEALAKNLYEQSKGKLPHDWERESLGERGFWMGKAEIAIRPVLAALADNVTDEMVDAFTDVYFSEDSCGLKAGLQAAIRQPLEGE